MYKFNIGDRVRIINTNKIGLTGKVVGIDIYRLHPYWVEFDDLDLIPNRMHYGDQDIVKIDEQLSFGFIECDCGAKALGYNEPGIGHAFWCNTEKYRKNE